MGSSQQFYIARRKAMEAKGIKQNRNHNANRVPLNERTGKEWDLRIDITDEWTIVDIIERLQCNKEAFTYLLVGGLEFGTAKLDRPVNNKWQSEIPEPHVHIAIISKNIITRQMALEFVRPHKTGGEYCKPRDQSQTYIGWLFITLNQQLNLQVIKFY